MLGLLALAAGAVILAMPAPPLCTAEEERPRTTCNPAVMIGRG